MRYNADGYAYMPYTILFEILFWNFISHVFSYRQTYHSPDLEDKETESRQIDPQELLYYVAPMSAVLCFFIFVRVELAHVWTMGVTMMLLSIVVDLIMVLVGAIKKMSFVELSSYSLSAQGLFLYFSPHSSPKRKIGVIVIEALLCLGYISQDFFFQDNSKMFGFDRQKPVPNPHASNQNIAIICSDVATYSYNWIRYTRKNDPNIQIQLYTTQTTPKRSEELLSLPDVYRINQTFVETTGESYAYVRYIVDHYDSLPDKLLFLHGHERAWHQREPLTDLVAHIKWDALDGYLSLAACSGPSNGEGFVQPLPKEEQQPDPGSKAGDATHKESDRHSLPGGKRVDQSFLLYLEQLNFTHWGLAMEPDKEIDYNYGAFSQFLTTRSDVHRLPLAFWQRLLTWMEKTPMSMYEREWCLELSWHFLLTGNMKGQPPGNARCSAVLPETNHPPGL
ncbi:hypothetical protein HDU91_001914 [Kappamyces sp. JEL0680]|nr:hypothetical protein HDU91_001914 [Kappamyces sp. JEL0680]